MVERVKRTVREHPVVVVALSALAVIAVLGVVVHLSARPDNPERRAATPSPSVRVSDSTVRAPESTTTRAAQPTATTTHVATLPQLPTTDNPAGYARDVAVARSLAVGVGSTYSASVLSAAGICGRILLTAMMCIC